MLKLTLFIRLALLLLVAVAIFAALLYFYQHKLIYYPRPYRADSQGLIPQRAARLEYSTSCGKQTAWYVPARSATDPLQQPRTLWIFFGGNASLALFWSNGVNAAPDDDAAFLLFDYPGYGYCEGKPTPESIAESGDAALAAVAAHLGVTSATLQQTRLGLMGHSLGAAAALQFATRHPAYKVVLAAPFTTLRAMANRTVSPALGWLLRHNFDNEASLRALQKQQPPPKVIVTHGTADPVVPVEMSRALKSQFPDLIEYIEVKGTDHEFILNDIERHISP